MQGAKIRARGRGRARHAARARAPFDSPRALTTIVITVSIQTHTLERRVWTVITTLVYLFISLLYAGHLLLLCVTLIAA